MECIVGRASEPGFIVRRNSALSATDRAIAYGFIALVTFGIAVTFACLGAWMVLPFAGVELLVLSLAFRWIGRHAEYCERLTIDGDALRVEIAEAGRVRRGEFNRWWAQVVGGNGDGLLAIRSHGREMEFGRHLTAGERVAVAGALRRQLRNR
jgi:uncharacterized membrane protein